jgi:uncharacterized small protein (DUF1192 family)
MDETEYSLEIIKNKISRLKLEIERSEIEISFLQTECERLKKKKGG